MHKLSWMYFCGSLGFLLIFFPFSPPPPQHQFISHLRNKERERIKEWGKHVFIVRHVVCAEKRDRATLVCFFVHSPSLLIEELLRTTVSSQDAVVYRHRNHMFQYQRRGIRQQSVGERCSQQEVAATKPLLSCWCARWEVTLHVSW